MQHTLRITVETHTDNTDYLQKSLEEVAAELADSMQTDAVEESCLA